MPFRSRFPSRDSHLQRNLVARVEDCERFLKNDAKERTQREKDLKANVDAKCAQLRVYMDESTETVRNMSAVSERIRDRVAIAKCDPLDYVQSRFAVFILLRLLRRLHFSQSEVQKGRNEELGGTLLLPPHLKSLSLSL